MVPSMSTPFIARLDALLAELDKRACSSSGDLRQVYSDHAAQVLGWMDSIQQGYGTDTATIEPAVREFERMCEVGA